MFRILLLIISLTVIIPSIYAKNGEVVVVIDPGHGGKDPGHLSLNSALATEKELNLKISQLVGGYIEKYLQNVKVIYTRTTDIYPSLDDRVGKANAIGADYFISIHCNGNENTRVHGTESHVHAFSSKKAVALAAEIEKQFSSRSGRHSRGIKDGNDRSHSIQVLKYTQMTSVLVECGFLTNVKEANYLNSTYGQEIIASAIFRAFRSFIQKQHPGIEFIKKEPNTGEFTIQLLSSKDPIDTKSHHFKNLPSEVNRTKLNTTSAYKYKYTLGSYATRKEAEEDLKIVRKNGYRDAFITKN